MRRLFGSVGLCLWASVAPALTADALWQSWQNAAAKAEVPLNAGTVLRDGPQITLQDVTVGPDGSGGGPRAVVTLPQVVLRGGADGGVSVDLGQARFDGGKSPNRVALQLRQSDLTLQFRETEDGLSWEAAAKDLALAIFAEDLGGIAEDVGVLPPLRNTKGDVTLRDFAATGWQRMLDGVAVEAHLSAGRVTYDVSHTDPVARTGKHQTGGQDDLVVDLSYATPKGVFGLSGDLLDNLDAGLRMSLAMASAASESRDSFTMPGGLVDVVLGSGPGSAKVDLGPEGLRVDGAQNDISMTMHSRALFGGDLILGLGAAAMEVVVPLTGTAPQSTALRIKVENLATVAGVWDKFDPERLLPRLPASFNLDIDGMLSPTVIRQFFEDPTQIKGAGSQLTLHSATLNAAGASLRALGAVTFTDSPTGYEGQAEVRLTGSAKLLDSLIAIGVVPNRIATGLRMGLAMGFDREGDAGDVLVSKIEARPDGSLYVNGARMR
jgi:hypothetical protein